MFNLTLINLKKKKIDQKMKPSQTLMILLAYKMHEAPESRYFLSVAYLTFLCWNCCISGYQLREDSTKSFNSQ